MKHGTWQSLKLYENFSSGTNCANCAMIIDYIRNYLQVPVPTVPEPEPNFCPDQGLELHPDPDHCER